MSPLFRRVGAWVAILTFTLSFGLPLANRSHPIWDDDAACGEADLVGPPRPHLQFEVIQPSDPAGHCALCHWLRAVGHAAPGSRSVASADLDPVGPGLGAPAAGHGRLVDVDRPSRAPPALS
jgi:hypothetical protein